MKKNLIFLATLFLSVSTYSQNIFPVKLDNCNTKSFCLDCGDQKAGYDENEFRKLNDNLTNTLNLKGMSGGVKFQVLVDAKGRGCVLSHTDNTKNPITLKIIEELNHFKNWKPAVTKNKKEEKSSINIAFLIKDSKINGAVERVDIDAFKKSFDKPNSPEIYNKSYSYKNENLKTYKFTVWNSKNSNLENNMNDHIAFDDINNFWTTIDGGLESYNGTTFQNRNPKNITAKNLDFYALENDNTGKIWTYTNNGTKNILNFFNNTWTIVPKEESGLDGVYEIINNPATNELFFCSDEGLTILKDGKWSNINKDKIKELPSNRVNYAKKDSKGRIWIGTFSGTTMIDEKGDTTNFENTNTILKGKCITSMDEDENGNIFFSLYEFGGNSAGKVNRNEGIAIRDANGTIKQFTTENSGIPFNHTNCVLYDRKEKVLWISTDRAGLVRYDLKDNWENYHNENSDIPTSYISTMKFDKNGNLFLATRQGIVKVEKK